MNHPLQVVRQERGIALIMSLLVLLVVGILGALLMASLSAESRLAGYSEREASALNIAEAGVAEASARIAKLEILYDATRPRAVAQIFNTAMGNVPVLGVDSVGLATGQPAGGWLSYSSAGRSPDALTAEFKTNRTRTAVIRYNPLLTPPLNTASGYPIFKITSTGNVNGVRRRIVAEMMQKPIVFNIHAALAADQPIDFTGNGVVCGFDHQVDTPEPAGESGRDGNPPCRPWETGPVPKYGAWTTQTCSGKGGAYQTGDPLAYSENNTGFYAGPWEAMSMQQAEFWPWIGAPRSTEPPSPLNGIFYLDQDAVKQNRVGSFGFHSAVGEGFLYVDGDLVINSSLTYRGVIYVEGDITINGQCWVLGAVIVKGEQKVMQNGGATILYSSEAIRQALARWGGQFVNLSWVESTPAP